MNTKTDLENIFTTIYNENIWSMGQNETKCGVGSTDDFTKSISKHLLHVIETYNIKSMIDTSCGDLNWMKHLFPLLKCTYLGIDIVKAFINENIKQFSSQRIQFVHDEFVEYLKTLPDNSIDLILCRHTCEHLSNEHIMKFLNEAKRVTKYLLLTTHRNATLNIDLIPTTSPYRPINLNLTPYSEYIGNNQIDSMYDGPASKFLFEMYINLYKFN
jgi:hypothetical protein